MDPGSLVQPGRQLRSFEKVEELAGTLEIPERPLMTTGYADIYCGLWITPQGKRVQVAVKELRTPIPKDRQTRVETLKTKVDTRLQREIFIWSRIKHPNLHALLGYRLEPKPRLISPWCRHGNMTDYLHANPDLTRCDKLRLIYQAACGLDHLHSRVPPICHADIKPENVLINDCPGAALSDFGLSRVVQDLEAQSGFTTSETIKGTVRYMASELFTEQKPNLASDVYAFGGFILTVMSGKPPFNGLPPHVILCRVVQDVPPIPKHHPNLPADDSLWKLMRRCWDKDPPTRPTMREVMELLEQIILQESNPQSGPDLASLTSAQATPPTTRETRTNPPPHQPSDRRGVQPGAPPEPWNAEQQKRTESLERAVLKDSFTKAASSSPSTSQPPVTVNTPSINRPSSNPSHLYMALPPGIVMGESGFLYEVVTGRLVIDPRTQTPLLPPPIPPPISAGGREYNPRSVHHSYVAHSGNSYPTTPLNFPGYSSNPVGERRNGASYFAFPVARGRVTIRAPDAQNAAKQQQTQGQAIRKIYPAK